MADLPVVCVFGAKDIELKSAGPVPHFETDAMDCRCYPTDNELYKILAKDQPVAIVSFGKLENFINLMSAPFCVRRMWLHYPDTSDMNVKGDKVFNCFLGNALARREG